MRKTQDFRWQTASTYVRDTRGRRDCALDRRHPNSTASAVLRPRGAGQRGSADPAAAWKEGCRHSAQADLSRVIRIHLATR